MYVEIRRVPAVLILLLKRLVTLIISQFVAYVWSFVVKQLEDESESNYISRNNITSEKYVKRLFDLPWSVVIYFSVFNLF